MKIEREVIQRELQHLRRQCAEEVESCAEEKRRWEEQVAQMRLKRRRGRRNFILYDVFAEKSLIEINVVLKKKILLSGY